VVFKVSSSGVAIAYDDGTWEAMPHEVFREGVSPELSLNESTAVINVLYEVSERKLRVSAFLYGLTSSSNGVWELFSAYKPGDVKRKEVFAKSPLDFPLACGEHVSVLGTVLPLSAGKGTRPQPVAPFYFAGLLRGQVKDERGKRRWALLRSASGEHFLSSFGSESLRKGDAPATTPDAAATLAAFQSITRREVKTVSGITPIRVSSVRGGGGGGSSGGGSKLKIPTSLKGLGPETLLSQSTPEIRRTAAARLAEVPTDSKWFNGVDMASAPKKQVANRLWRSAKGRWAPELKRRQ
jgi:hypothetical protein